MTNFDRERESIIKKIQRGSPEKVIERSGYIRYSKLDNTM